MASRISWYWDEQYPDKLLEGENYFHMMILKHKKCFVCITDHSSCPDAVRATRKLSFPYFWQSSLLKCCTIKSDAQCSCWRTGSAMFCLLFALPSNLSCCVGQEKTSLSTVQVLNYVFIPAVIKDCIQVMWFPWVILFTGKTVWKKLGEDLSNAY